MNDFDRDNLNFFINGSQQEFDDWADQAADDELQYAMELIRTARREILEQEAELLDQVEDMSQAQSLLKQFTLGK
jgi:hypothetical protein